MSEQPPLSLEFRQILCDAAVAELQRQLGAESVDQDGTFVQMDGGFRMARVIEAVVIAAFERREGMIEEVARLFGSGEARREDEYRAMDAISAVRGWMLSQLDPLP